MSTSIGYENPFSLSYNIGSNRLNTSIPLGQRGNLGGAIPGFVAQPINDTDYSDEFAQTRFTLRQAWNARRHFNRSNNTVAKAQTPFRMVTNSGDLLSRQSYSCGGSCQSFQSRPGLRGLRFNSIQSRCDGTDVQPSSCNVRYVYDSSDYITYLKQKAVNKNYNDLSTTGNDYHNSQSAIRAAHRY